MNLQSGTRLGPYEIVAPIGAGGMGEVYRARDTRLNRSVAIKVLPAEFAQDIKFRVRFDREAKSISALNHPHICTLHDVGRENGLDYLVMEYCEGKTLAKRLADGPIPIEQVLQYGTQICDALEKAYRQGIIHRDLKPSNIMLTKSGVKLLDFGLAKQHVESSAVESTVQAVTEEGKILGTIQYMAPELFLGKDADARSDIFAVGLVLYEMATGKPAFSGASKASLIAAILEHEPPSISSLQPLAPAAFDRVVKSCLAKDPDERIQAAHDLLLELKLITDLSLPAIATPTMLRRSPLLWISATVVVAIALVAGFFASKWASPRPAPSRLMRTSISLPLPFSDPDIELFAISPDGKQLAYTAWRDDGREQIYLRPLDQFEAKPIPGTEDGYTPFFSPDGQWIGFAATKKLMKLPLSGGTPVTICEADRIRGATWGPNDTIVFATFDSPLLRVEAQGGIPKAITEIKEQSSHRFPVFLPDGRHVLYTEADFAHVSWAPDRARNVAVVDLQTGNRKVVLNSAWYGRFSGGHLFFTRDDIVFMVPFDLQRLEITGRAVPVLTDVATHQPGGNAHFAVSREGTVVYVRALPPSQRELIWIDRKGNMQPILSGRPVYSAHVSADGRRIAVIIQPEREPRDVWVYDLDRESWTRLTFEADNPTMAWSPDATQILFTSNRNTSYNLYVAAADGTGTARQITHGPASVVNSSWSGNIVAFEVQVPKTGRDIWTMNIEDEKSARPFLSTPFEERAPSLSPDSRWIAYSSNESGRDELYVQAHPGPGRKWPISKDGFEGIAKWSRDGKRLYYHNGHRLMEVDVETLPTFRAGKPRLLFETPFARFDVAPDGRFLLTRGLTKPEPPRELRIVQGLVPPTS